MRQGFLNGHLYTYTAEEEAAQDAEEAKVAIEIKAAQEAYDAAVAKKATDKASAKTKLKALGLTDDEIEALYGS
jgi:predicted TPR repeat methyltransferase|tara:strand:- start:46 stop:267 length:222 start_codon:yes stop_codon:yes gene_type:complete